MDYLIASYAYYINKINFKFIIHTNSLNHMLEFCLPF
jgi:hypothetical protein